MKILNMEHESGGRDQNIINPVIQFLRRYYKYEVIQTNMLFGVLKMLIYKPDVFIMSNDIGSDDNSRYFHFANALGIRTISLTSEGLFIDNSTAVEGYESGEGYNFIWGNNIKHEDYLDLKLHWNRRYYDYCCSIYPELKGKNIKIAGGPGFDRYRLLEFKDQMGFKKQYSISSDNIVLLIGYPFYDIYKSTYDNLIEGERIASELNVIYDRLIAKHQNITFILKAHPASRSHLGTRVDEFRGLNKYRNVLCICEEEEISDCLNVADIVIGYDSTAVLEAWLLKKPTLMINNAGTDFVRSNIYTGNPIATDFESLDGMLEEFLHAGGVTDFNKLADERRKVIIDNILCDDGANFIRSAKLIDDEIRHGKAKNKTIKIGEAVKEIVYEIAQGCALIIYKIIGAKDRYVYREYSNFDKQELHKVNKHYHDAIKSYIKQNEKLVREIINNYDGETL